MRALIVLLALSWGALSLWALYGIQTNHPPPGSFVAKRELVFGHRIVPGDVAAVPLLSAY